MAVSKEPDTSSDVNFDGEISRLDSLAIHAHEIFTSLKRSGFSHRDAITLVGHLISSGFMEINNYINFSDSSEEEDFSSIDDPDDEDFI